MNLSLLLLLSLLCLCASPALGQRQSDQQGQEIRRLEEALNQSRQRHEDHEKESTERQVKQEARMSVLETKLGGMELVLWVVVAAVVGLVADLVRSRVILPRRENNKEKS